MFPLPFGILLSFCFFLSHSETNKLSTTAITFAHLTLASIWRRIWEACEILTLKHGSIAFWYSSCHSVFFSIIRRANNFITTAITFAHLTLASIWKRIWDASEILTLKHGSFAFWYSFVILFFSLSFRDKQTYTTAITFAHLTLASIWKRIWEACEILTLKHGSIAFGILLSFSFFLYHSKSKQFYYNGNNFCAFDASFDLKRIWEACEILTLKHGSIPFGILLSFCFFLYHSRETNL